MTLQTQNTALSPNDAYLAIRGNAQNIKVLAQNALATLQGGSVSSQFIFAMLDQLIGIVNSLTTLKATSGIDAYATSQGYTGTMSSDCTSCASAASTCITWVVTNFPASGGFLQADSINADGTRTHRLFTTAQTAGLQTNLQAFIATIG